VSTIGFDLLPNAFVKTNKALVWHLIKTRNHKLFAFPYVWFRDFARPNPGTRRVVSAERFAVGKVAFDMNTLSVPT
jgi:hypothetical protein